MVPPQVVWDGCMGTVGRGIGYFGEWMLSIDSLASCPHVILQGGQEWTAQPEGTSPECVQDGHR